MFHLQNEWREQEIDILEKLRTISIDHMIVARKAKMTLCEILHCMEICEKRSLAPDLVFAKMAAFKESSAHLIYKEDFSLA